MLPHIFFIVLHQSVVMTLAILGNLFLLFVIFRGNHVSRRRISPVQLLLIHTCVADLLFALLSLGTEILTMISYPHFIAPDFICKAMRYAQMFPHYASPFLLVAISADRYQAICRPLANFRASRYRRPNYLAAIAWTLALACSIPQLFVWEKRKSKRGEECATIYGQQKNIIKNIYVIVFNTIAWLLPSIFAGYFYYRVCKAVWISGNRAPKVSTSEKTELVTGDQTQDYIDKLRKKSYGFQKQNSEFDRKRVQTVRLTMTIIVCNFFLWMPFCIVNVMLALWPAVLSPSFYLYVMTLGNLNSCVNPWIYIIFNKSHVIKAFCNQRNNNSNGGITSQYRTEDSRVSCKRTLTVACTNGASLYKNIQGANNVSFNAKTLLKEEEEFDPLAPTKISRCRSLCNGKNYNHQEPTNGHLSIANGPSISSGAELPEENTIRSKSQTNCYNNNNNNGNALYNFRNDSAYL